MKSIKTHLTAALLLCILLPTALIGGVAYWFTYNNIRENRIKDVGQVADARYEELRLRLYDYDERGRNLLHTLLVACRGTNNDLNACVRAGLEQFVAIDHAVSVTLHSATGGDFSVGGHAMPFERLNKSFAPAQIAATGKINGSLLLSFIATDPASGFTVITTYPAQVLQNIFAGASMLRGSGETFLADSQGFFIAGTRYHADQGALESITALPMQQCLGSGSGETLDFDYRNVPIIRGFRFVPEIGGGCIMAHIEQDGAFAALNRFAVGMSLSALVFLGLIGLAAAMMGRNISRSLVALVGMARELVRGNFEPRYSSTQYREIAELEQLFTHIAGQLDLMLSRLRAAESELERKAHQWAAELNERHRRYHSVIQSSGEGYWRVDQDGYLLEVNPAYARFVGYDQAELVGMHITNLEANELPEETAGHIRQIIQQGSDTFETRHRRKDGSLWDAEVSVTFINEDGGYFVAFFRDVTERKRIEQELRIAASAFETQEGITITDADQIIVRVNKAFTQITGYAPDEVIGKKISMLKSGHHDQAFYQAMQEALRNEGQWEGEIWDRHKDGHIYPKWLAITAVKNHQGLVTHFIGNFTDITERKTSEEKIKRLAFYDTLTGLANRRLLTERLEHSIVMQQRTGHYGALLFLDLDNFKLLNDSHGHGVGDELLVQVAQRLKASVRETDTVARLGGDEFIVLLEECGTGDDSAALQVKSIAEKILAVLAEPYVLSSVTHNCSSSIGIVLYGNGTSAADAVLSQADTAMYAAKKNGKNAYRFFDPAMQQELEQRAKFESALRLALSNNQLKLYYQPQVDDSKQMVGVEALIRWYHPELGVVNPVHFIPLAEETDIILAIGDWVLETACAQLKAWQNHPLTGKLSIAVNVSVKQFYQPGFVDKVRRLMAQYDIKPMQLKLELTESMVLKDLDVAVAKMLELKEIGAMLSMDDFGTGYSSLSYLKNLPFDQIKIDKSFMDGIKTCNKDAYIIHSVITLGNLMRIGVVAEGVEDAEQDELLKSLGCKVFQGYLFGRPVPIEELEAKLLAEGGSSS